MRELVQLIETEGREKLVLNLSSVEFLASAALGELIAVHKKVAARNGILKLCCVHPELGRLFTVTRLDSLFNIAASEADAVAARPAGGIENCRSCRSGFRRLLITPAPPHAAVGGLDVPGKTRGVHQRRLLHPIAQRGAEPARRGRSLASSAAIRTN